MIVNVLSQPSFSVEATLGRYRSFTKLLLSEEEVRSAVERVQRHVYATTGVPVSVRLSFSEILFLGQREPCFTLHFIQYPKFPQEEATLSSTIKSFVCALMAELEQLRAVICFPQETLLLETTEQLDPDIQLQTTVQ
ncbi:hypothetical protein [Robertkochia sediminum]|uniref:hypothetical protein n=1 Tax=Robertkochia sediminum TaxID=2785326 RepID=UPI001933E2C9|nr:hypothetical protein [Robertkochia sediminum]MBL7471396.1 hypothetical protein [Robertkochia sediminum]